MQETIIPCRYRKISDVFDAFPLATGVDTKKTKYKSQIIKFNKTICTKSHLNDDFTSSLPKYAR